MRRGKPVVGITTDAKPVDGAESFCMDAVYAREVLRYGGFPIFVPSIPDEDFLRGAVSRVDGILLPGGRDIDPVYYGEELHPSTRLMSRDRTDTELKVVSIAIGQGKPILGVCNGMQLINVYFGGSLYQDIPSQLPDSLPHGEGSVHDVEVVRDTLLFSLLGKRGFRVRSYHHQCIKRLGTHLVASAVSPDGVVEAIEASGVGSKFLLGIQWHPEREHTEVSWRLFRAFLESCSSTQTL
ncbi:MAG: gamma-glutamyl-gamma-aminobutyrate hydrolase family protein [Candidatus Caldarchaeum sp.]